MPLTSEQIQQRPLNGSEWKDYLVKAFREVLEGDCLLSKSISYPRAGATIICRLHLTDPLPTEHEIRVYNRAGSKLEDPPLPVEEGKESAVVAFDIEVKADNPNLIRVHADLPIEVQTAIPPRPGQLLPSIETHQIHYAKEDYPEPAAPVVVDKVADAAAEWQIKMAKAVRQRRENRSKERFGDE